MNYFNNINLNQNELQKPVMHPLEQPPATAKQGQMYFNTVDKKLYYYDSTKWVALNDVDLSNYVTTTQLNGELNKKLDKKTTGTSNTQVYAVTGNEQKMIDATSAATGNTVVLRDANGKLQVAAGAVAADAVNKGQMDTAIATAVSGCERTNNKVGTITDPGNDTQYPNTKAVVNYVKSQVSKVKDVTLDGTSIVNTETGVVALESTYSLTLTGASGTLKPTEYDNLSGDDASYIWYTQTGVQPIRLTKVMSGEGSLQYQAVVSDTVMAVIIQSDKTWEFVQFNVEKEPYHFTYEWGTALTEEQKAGIQNDPNCYFFVTLSDGVTYHYRRAAVKGNRYYFTSTHEYSGTENGVFVGQMYVDITTGWNIINEDAIYAENLKNKTDVLNAQSTNKQYPSAKAVVDYVGDNSAPKDHATTATTYGVGTTQKYGHVKLVTGDMNGKVNVDGQVPSLDHTHSQYALLSGATFTGDVTIGGDLTVNGTTTTIESTTLAVKDKLIEVASGNTVKLTTPAGLVVPKYDGTKNGALVFDGDGIAYVGDVTLNANGDIDVANSNLVALAGRAKTIAGGNLVKWDKATQTFVDAGIAASKLATVDDIPTNYVTTDTAQTISGAKTFSKEVAFDNHIRANGGVGTDGQVLTSQGVDKPPVWKTVSAPSNMVTTDTSQTITASKIFSKEVAFNDQIRVNGSVGTAGQVLTSQGAGKVPQWTTLTIPQGTVKKFVRDFTGNNTNLEFSYEHELGTNQCTVSLYKLNDSNNYEMVMADIILTATNVIIKFAQAPSTTDSFRVVVTG